MASHTPAHLVSLPLEIAPHEYGPLGFTPWPSGLLTSHTMAQLIILTTWNGATRSNIPHDGSLIVLATSNGATRSIISLRMTVRGRLNEHWSRYMWPQIHSHINKPKSSPIKYILIITLDICHAMDGNDGMLVKIVAPLDGMLETA